MSSSISACGDWRVRSGRAVAFTLASPSTFAFLVKTPADIMNEIVPAVAGNSEFAAILPAAGVAKRETIRGVRRGNANYGPDHPFWKSVLAYAEGRAPETARARDTLARGCKEADRKPHTGMSISVLT